MQRDRGSSNSRERELGALRAEGALWGNRCTRALPHKSEWWWGNGGGGNKRGEERGERERGRRERIKEWNDKDPPIA